MKPANDLLLRAAKGETVERPPVWLMRQAGRILPQYRAIRESLTDFKELVETPALAAEVTVQPVDELGVDAAILFSDILVIPQAMGLPYEMAEKRGPWFPQTVRTAADVEALIEGEDAAQRLFFVYEAITQTNAALAGRVPLIGFAGAPWTLLAYMVEGQGSKTFTKAKQLLYAEPALAHRLLEKITTTVIAYLRNKVKAGVHLVQLFDSWAGLLGPETYRSFALPYIRQICEAIGDVPVTIFAKGAWYALEDFAALPCQVIGLDWTMDPAQSRSRVGEGKVLQGNLDPCILFSNEMDISRQTRQMLDAFGPGHIANLGHGVYPETPLDHVRCFVDTVKAYRYL